MELKKNKKDVENALTYLLEKYSIQTMGSIQLYETAYPMEFCLQPGYEFLDNWQENYQVPLLSWRMKRKFIELKKIVKDYVIEDACLFRISCMASGDNWTLAALLYRELDLCEFISNGKIITIQAIINDDQSANVILKLDNGILCSIEVNVQLPANTSLLDRHEIIGRRGVASDLVVDTQITQNSVYSFTEKGESKYTDVDMELYGFDDLQINHIRAAFHVLKNPVLIIKWKQQHQHLINLIKTVFDSNEKHIKINLKNEPVHETY